MAKAKKADLEATAESLSESADAIGTDGQQESLAEQYEAAVEAAEAGATEPDAAPSLAELEAEHYAEIKRINGQVDAALDEWNEAKAFAKECKELHTGLVAKLTRLIRRGPEAQRKLPLTDPEEGDAPIANDAWRDVPIRELADYGMSDSLHDLLRENRLDTLGDLDDFWKSGKRLYDLKGIGEEKAARIADAFADYGVDHPELFGKPPEQSADEAAE